MAKHSTARKLLLAGAAALTLGLASRCASAQNDQQCVNSAVAGGTSDAITIPALPCALTTNLLILTIAADNISTAPTLSVGGQAPQVILKGTNQAIAIGDLGGAGYRALLTPTGFTWLLLNPATTSGGGGGGTVTSVGLASPAGLFSISGSPVTTTGTLTETLVSQSANTFFRGPQNGGPAQPSFGPLVPADLPIATTLALGGVKPDGSTITVAADGVITSIAGGTGTVTSVGLSLPGALFTLSGTPVTTSGTLTGSLATHTANTIFAGPGSGGATAPTFRAMVNADLPTQVNFQPSFSITTGGAVPANSTLFIQGTRNGTAGGATGGSNPDVYIADIESISNSVTAGTTDALFVDHLFGTGTGSRDSIRAYLTNTAATASGGSAFYTAIFGTTAVAFNDGGTSMTPKGDFYAFGGLASAVSGATFLHGLIGAEFDVSLPTGSSAAEKFALQLAQVNSDAVPGSGADAFLAMVDDGTVTTPFSNGIVFGKPGTPWPVTGCLMCVYSSTTSQAVTSGIDLSPLTISGNAWASPGGVNISGGGLINGQFVQAQQNFTAVSHSAPGTVAGGNYAIYMDSADGKLKAKAGTTVTVLAPSTAGSGTVTSVTCGTGLTGGTFTTSGTCASGNGANLAGNGHWKDAATGLIWNWGTVSVTASGSFASAVSFDLAFSSAPLTGGASIIGGTSGGSGTPTACGIATSGNSSTSGSTVFISGSSSIACSWWYVGF